MTLEVQLHHAYPGLTLDIGFSAPSPGITVLFGLSGVLSALGTMTVSPLFGIVMLVGSLLGVVIGVVFARIAAEFILIVFRINEHLGAIRNRGEM